MGWNSAPVYGAGSITDLREAIGVPQFSGTNSDQWAFVFNGMIFQGGVISVPAGITVFPFPAPLTQQVLGVFLQPTAKLSPAVSATALDTFSVDHTGATHDCYWFAVGV
jgi:hypothetical protein